MKRSTKIMLTAAAVVGAGVIIKKVMERDIIQDKVKEYDALDYLTDKYGEEALAGKKILIVNDDDHATKSTIAKDVVDYELHK
ncbi:MAG TPA: hypothetical protein VIG45_04655 [Erysipelothrix sp.]